MAVTRERRRQDGTPASLAIGRGCGAARVDALLAGQAAYYSAPAEQELLGACTDLLLRQQGVRPGHPVARALAWVFVHRHETYVAGAPAEAPHYKFVCQVPEGQYDEERRAAITRGDDRGTG